MSETLEAIAEEIVDRAESLGDVERSTDGVTATFSRSSEAFAVADPAGFEFRVGTTIAAAALRTPDVSESSRGGDWVRFEPTELERTAVDRAVAWFEAAWRRGRIPTSRART